MKKTLDENHEIALTFPEHGGPFVLDATRSGGNEFIAFELLFDTGEKFTVIQTYSHVNFAVSSKLKANFEVPARRAGFHVED